jgi:hypothetical protein
VSSMISMPSFAPSASKSHDKGAKREQNPPYSHYNGLIGHLDRKSVLDGEELGGADKCDWDRFWLDLQDFVHTMHKHYVDPAGHFYLNGIGNLSDADSLVKALRESTYFHTLVADAAITHKCADVAFGSKYSGA